MRLRRKSNGQIVELSESNVLGKGGEARVYKLAEDPALVAKIWHKPTPERAAKVAVMAANPPHNPTAEQKHASIAWPSDILETGRGETVGFLMPLVSGMHPIIDFFNPKSRREKCPLFNYFYLHRTARNLVIAARALHERSYVIGDLNESNVLVAETALVTIVDTDSFQVWDAEKGKVYRCKVGKPEFTPPEMQGKTFGQFNRDIPQDLFGLGIILFELLMEGTHPFAGSYAGHGEPPPYEQRIAAGYFPYAAGMKVPITPKATAPPFEMLYPSLQHLFVRCFQDGHFRPSARPDTQAWQWALEEAETALVTCWHNDQHIYSGHLQSCPWCERTKLLGGRDPFPSVEAVKSGAHLAPPPKAKPRSMPHRAPLAGHRNLPPAPSNPPLPRRIPPSGSQPSSNRPFAGFPGPRNDWAYLSLFLGTLAIMLAIGVLAGWSAAAGMTVLLGGLAVATGGVGELQSHGWYLDGKGQIPARIGMVAGAIALLLTLGRDVSKILE